MSGTCMIRLEYVHARQFHLAQKQYTLCGIPIVPLNSVPLHSFQVSLIYRLPISEEQLVTP